LGPNEFVLQATGVQALGMLRELLKMCGEACENRNPQSFTADLKNERDRARVKRLLARADVVVQNFRPGVMEKLRFDYESLRQLNPRIFTERSPAMEKLGAPSPGRIRSCNRSPDLGG
jgi:CoA-transferase family III